MGLRWVHLERQRQECRHSIDRIRDVMRVFKGVSGYRKPGVPSRKVWHALQEVDRYLRDQSNRLVNYAKRYCADLRVGTSIHAYPLVTYDH